MNWLFCILLFLVAGIPGALLLVIVIVARRRRRRERPVDKHRRESLRAGEVLYRNGDGTITSQPFDRAGRSLAGQVEFDVQALDVPRPMPAPTPIHDPMSDTPVGLQPGYVWLCPLCGFLNHQAHVCRQVHPDHAPPLVRRRLIEELRRIGIDPAAVDDFRLMAAGPQLGKGGHVYCAKCEERFMVE